MSTCSGPYSRLEQYTSLLNSLHTSQRRGLGGGGRWWAPPDIRVLALFKKRGCESQLSVPRCTPPRFQDLSCAVYTLAAMPKKALPWTSVYACVVCGVWWYLRASSSLPMPEYSLPKFRCSWDRSALLPHTKHSPKTSLISNERVL
jgi:hypothetical protein